jgi:hypothetical protein
MAEKYSNNGQSTLLATIGAGDTTLQVANAAVFPSAGNFRLVIDTEILLASAVAGNTFTVSRGQEGTAAAPHNAGTLVTHVLTAAVAGNFAAKPEANTFTVGPQTIQTGGNANGALILQENSTSQSGDYLDIEKADGTILAGWYVQGSPFGLGGGYHCPVLFWRGGVRDYQVGVNDNSGAIQMGFSDSGDGLRIQGFTGCVQFKPVLSNSQLYFVSSGGILQFCSKEGGGQGVIQFGVRFSDGSSAVGSTHEFWPKSGQSVPVICSVAPGGGTGYAAPVAYRFQVNPDGSLTFGSESSTTNGRTIGKLTPSWANSTDATRKGRVQHYASDASADRECLRLETDGSQALVGFFGVTAVARQTGGAATAGASYGVNEQTMLNAVYSALRNYGLLT